MSKKARIRAAAAVAVLWVAAAVAWLTVGVTSGSAATGAPRSQPAPLAGAASATVSASATSKPRAATHQSTQISDSPSSITLASGAPVPSENAAAAGSIVLPPPPHSLSPSVAASGSGCPSYVGTNAAATDVSTALVTAADTTRTFGYDVPGSTTQTVAITTPQDLLAAIAWQESGWQSAIVSCDGGYGTMQIMSGTASWMNGSFHTAYDDTTLAGNTQIGAEYVDWLIAYFGQVYYNDDFDLSSNRNLLDDVISAYNDGPGNVNPTGTSSGILNPQYVSNVEALMTLQPWSG
ncbi:MAG TPA: lytic transglycosylase domain-containing protein [Actinocrinis sp.]|jgi:soluble lytic murein transglycosylase-like protein